MIRTLVTGAAVLLMLPAASAAQDMSAPPVVMPDAGYPGPMRPMPPMLQGYEAPQGYDMPRGYDMPLPTAQSEDRLLGYGSTLPRGWIAPAYHLGDFDDYDLPVPAAGFGWSRYYDDAVLTDRFGRVYDVRHDFERDRRHRRHHRDERYAYGRAQPHWDMGYFDGRGPGYGGYGAAIVDCGCGETVTTTTTTRLPGTARQTRYRTVSYDVRTAPRLARRPARGKYVRVDR